MGSRIVRGPGIGEPGAQLTPFGIQIPDDDDVPGSSTSGASWVELIAHESLSGGRVVRVSSGSPDGAVYARPPERAASAPLGITMHASEPLARVRVWTDGALIDDAQFTWTPGLPVFLGAAGVLTQDVPQLGYVVVMGFAVSGTAMLVRIAQPTFLDDAD